MAIDKSNTKPWVKVIIIMVALSFVAAFIPGLFTALSNSGQRTSNNTTASGGKLEQVAKDASGQVGSLKGLLASDPTSYTILVALGNAYFDWGALASKASASSGASIPMWEAATIYYSRALKVQPGDPNVGTDMAIAYFYGGQTAEAITAVEAVLGKDPEFASALYNAGIFYQAAGRNADGIAALNKYLALNPQNQADQVARARKLITEMQGTAGTTPATTTP